MYFFFSGRDFVEETLGSKYVVGRTLDFATSFEESGPATPMFFILSPGVNPLKDVENQGEKVSSWGQGCSSPMHFYYLHLSVSLFQIQGSLCNTCHLLIIQKSGSLLYQYQGIIARERTPLGSRR